MKRDPKTFFVGVKGLIIKDDKVLLFWRSNGAREHWDIPGGRIDGDDAIHETLLREVKEELPNAGEVAIGQLLTAQRLPHNIRNDIGLTLLIYEIKVDLPEVIELSDEHDFCRWMTFEEAAKKELWISEALKAYRD